MTHQTANALVAGYLRTIQSALADSHLLVLTFYCDKTDCPAREVEIRVKDLDGTWEPKGYYACPICGCGPLKLHDAVTFRAHEEEEERRSRQSVNTQMFQRDAGTDFIPGNVLTDSRLPPAPDGWFGPSTLVSRIFVSARGGDRAER